MPTAPHAIDRFFSGAVQDKLASAEELFSRYGADLLQEKTFLNKLSGLRARVVSLERHMETMEMGARCAACAAQPGGGCCSAYMAGNSDVLLLLINMLIGVEVNLRHHSGSDCGFLGKRGCILSIKPIFCLNYNCTHIRGAASEGQMRLLDKHAGTVLSLQTEIETMLLERIMKKPETV